MRERFGVRFFTVPLVAVVLVSFLVLASEIGGVSPALQFVSGVSFRWWAPIVAIGVWLLLWAHNFSVVEKGAAAQYWFMAVSIIGASVSPYLFYFYSAGAIEDHWDESYLGVNRAIAGLGMGFGGSVAVAVLAVAAVVRRAFISVVACLVALVAIPLQLLGS